MISKIKYPFEVHCLECYMLVCYIKNIPKSLTTTLAKDAVYPDGRIPKKGEVIHEHFYAGTPQALNISFKKRG